MTEERIQSVNLDANQTAFFTNELRYVKSQTYDVKYPRIKATQLLPVSNSAGPGAETITYQQFDKLGMAKIIANYADDLPRADVKGAEFTSHVRSIGDSYGYDIQEIRNAQFAGRNLESRKAKAARELIERKIDEIAWFGDSDYGLQGLVGHDNVTRVAAADNQGATSKKWENKTPDEIYQDMTDLVNGIVELTKEVEAPDTLIMPTAQYNIIRTKRFSDASDTTILQYFLNNNGYVDTVDSVSKLKNAGIGVGAVSAGEDVMIAYENNPQKLTLEIPQPFEQFAAQEEGLEFKVPCHARCGGVIIYYPLSVSVMEGI